jgi:hypothetical protein
MPNPWSRAAKPKPKGKLSLLGGKAKTNGKAPAKPTLAALAKGKPQPEPKPKVTLGAALGVKPPVEERPHQEPKPRVKEDFRVDGILFSGAEITDRTTLGYRDGVYRTIGTVDVTNGDQTYTFHNRYGSWMHDVWHGGGMMFEPARVAAMLNINMSQVDMARALSRRFEAEMKKQGILTAAQQRAHAEAKAAEARKRSRKPIEETTEVTPKKKISLRGVGKK